MKKCYFFFTLIAILIVTLSNSDGPAHHGNGGRTGAPGEGTCNNCHSGGVFTPSTQIQVFENGTNIPATFYYPNSTYDIKVTVSSTTGSPKFGFQLTALKGANVMAGSFNSPASNTRVSAAGSRTYIEHFAMSASGIFTAKWVAPSSGSGNVTFYAFGNCVNASGNFNGDIAAGTSLMIQEGNLALPVSLINFNCVRDQTVSKLTWSTSSEHNNAHFNLQHSVDGIVFTTIATITSQAIEGNSNAKLNYSYIDETPSAGLNYYRLQQVDLDGKEHLIGGITKVSFDKIANDITFFPIPVMNVLHIKSFITKFTTIKLLDLNGQLVTQLQALPLQSNSEIKLNLESIKQGIYFVQIFENNVLIKSEKIMKD